MNEEEMMAFAAGCGFEKVAVVDTKELVFDPSFRPYCEENLCGQYGANYTCPPACGTPEEMKNRILRYPKALVMESLWPIADWRDKEAVRQAKALHNHWQIELQEKAREQGREGFLVGSSGCSLCSPCAMRSGKPCRFPDLRWSCMSAYCIYVQKLAETCGMDYTPKPGYLTLYGMFVYR